MTKNLYYRTLLRRENIIKKAFLSFFDFLASYTRLLLEVFIRKNFGERYFKLSSALTVTLILAVIPFIPKPFYWYFNLGNYSIMPSFLTWYIFLAAFVFVSFKRDAEIKNSPSVYDFAKFSLSSGVTNPFFYTIQLPGGKKTDRRTIETLLEPAPYFIAGILLYLVGQKLGNLLIFCSIFYSLGYAYAYSIGDDFIMDKIDEIISNEELEKAFVHEAPEDETRGFRFMGRRPASEEMRRKILPLMMEEQEVFIAT